MNDEKKQDRSNKLFYDGYEHDCSVKDEFDYQTVMQNIKASNSVPKKTLIMQELAVAALVLLITVALYIVTITAMSGLIDTAYTAEFIFFICVVIFAAVTAICVKLRDKIRLKDVFTVLLFSIACAVAVFMQNKLMYIFVMTLALAASVTVSIFINNTARKVFIPFMAFFLVLTVMFGVSSLLSVYDVEFTADYFYFSLQQESKTTSAPNYYSAAAISEEDISNAVIYYDYMVISSKSRFDEEFFDSRKNSDNELAKSLAQMLEKSETVYDDEFFPNII